ncbi:MAG TPA: prepilin-type N-terminal cleavage/methylation domain-containing protein [Vicinamibacterales bacterium]
MSITARSESGFTLVELLVSMTITAIVMAGAFMVFSQATRMNQVAAETISVNRDQANAMDLVVRDLLQVGQGLPSSKVVSVPNGTGITINRPGPTAATVSLSDWPAVLPGPGSGPSVDGGPATDVLTLLYVDTMFVTSTGQAPAATVAANGASMTVTAPITLEVGDLVLFDVSGRDAVQVATGVTVDASSLQTVQFAAGDKLNFNQRTATAGTILQIQPVANTAFTANVSRLRMITYYIDANRTPAALIRCLNNQCVGSNPIPGQVVALGVENLQFSFDIVDGDTNPSNIKMTATDLAGGGACGTDPCSTNQIRKANVALSMRSRHRVQQLNDFVHRLLTTQVSLRNLSFVDRYPTT